MNSPTLSYDREAKALYVQFSEEPIASTIELSLSVYVDFDADGNAVGFEILHADPELLTSLLERTQPAMLRDLINVEAA
jgi:uncharacterized protein YuzE